MYIYYTLYTYVYDMMSRISLPLVASTKIILYKVCYENFGKAEFLNQSAT